MPIWIASHRQILNKEELEKTWKLLASISMSSAIELSNSVYITSNPILFEIRKILYVMNVQPPATCPE